jgi:hypothetical protein
MKKFTVLFLTGILILAFGATASAQAPKLEFRASGFIDTQTFIGVNVPSYQSASGLYGQVNGAFATTFPSSTIPAVSTSGSGLGGVGFNKTDSHWESRAHLKFDAIMGPNLSGTIYFEIDTFRYGAPWTGGIGLGREANNFGGWTTDRTSVEVKNIYIDVGLPYFGIPVPITVRVGAQPIGVRPAMLVYSDGTGVTAGIKIDPVLISPIYAKALEGNDFQDDDVDIWGLQASAKISTFTVGGYGLYYRMNSYPLWVSQPVTFGLPAVMIPVAPGSDKAHMWWLGAYADGKAGPVNINFDFVYDFGNVQNGPNKRATAPDWGRHVKYEGWATRAKIDYPWDKFNFGAVGMYARGSDANQTSTNGLPGTLTANGGVTRRVSGYVVPPGSEQGPGNAESMVVYSMEAGAVGGYGLANRANYAQLSPGGFGGTWFAKLYGSVKATPWWKITFQGLYVGDTTKHGNTLGNAFKYPGVPFVGATLAAAGGSQLRNDSDVGVELDLINEFQIYNNLRFFVGAGYLFAGDATDVGKTVRYGAAAPFTFVNVNRSIANPWAVRTRLQYVF